MSDPHRANRADELRSAFDRSFAESPKTVVADIENYLGIGLADDFYMIHLAEVRGLFADKKIVPLPSQASACLGVAGLRGDIVPVHCLRTILGYASDDAAPRWLILANAPIALTFDRFEGYLQISKSAVASSKDASPRGHVLATAPIAGGPCPILSLQSIIDTVTQQTGQDGHSGDR
jgi:chemotaxis signal transduction protein